MKLEQNKLHSTAGHICKDKDQGHIYLIYFKFPLAIINCLSLCNLENANEKFSKFCEASQKASFKVFSITITSKKKKLESCAILSPFSSSILPFQVKKQPAI